MKKTIRLTIMCLVFIITTMLFLDALICLPDITFAQIIGDNIEWSENDDFAEDKVLIVIDEENSISFKNYTVRDFSDIGVVFVEELTIFTKEVLKRQIETKTIGDDETAIDPKTYRTILCLTIKEKGKQEVIKAIKQLQNRKDIISAEPDIAMHCETTTPNDPYYVSDYQWGLDGTYGINAAASWFLTSGSPAVKVGIIDFGIDASHEDLENRVDVSSSRDFTIPYPYVPNSVVDTDIMQQGHGTHVAGIIGAEGNNNLGITGVAQNVRLVSLLTGQSINNSEFSSRLVLAINYATAYNIPILNHSMGYDNYQGTTNDVNAVATALNSYPGLFINSAGNSNHNNDNLPNRFPSNLDAGNMIVVGAIEENGERWTEWSNGTIYAGSNYGSTTVDLFAPGDYIATTNPTGFYDINDQNYISAGYHYATGTSMAAPFVAGVSALLLSYNSTLTGAQLKQIIISSVTEVNGLNGYCVAGGILNAFEALGTCPPPHTHNFGGYTYLNSTYHQRTCTTCNYTQQASHTYSYQSISVTDGHYKICNVCSHNFGAEGHVWLPQFVGGLQHGYKCKKCDLWSLFIDLPITNLSPIIQQLIEQNAGKDDTVVVYV